MNIVSVSFKTYKQQEKPIITAIYMQFLKFVHVNNNQSVRRKQITRHDHLLSFAVSI
jgi:hypothetical protein